MGKYSVELELDFKNSLSLILKRVKGNSKILEFGPASGRLTEYLQVKLGCELTIVEIDKESGTQAAKFAKQSFLGKDQGDIESFFWFEKLENEKFDAIIFADVLEHLHDPETVLVKAKKLLSETGSILISIPNIAHNAVLIDLINNKFQYNSIGLLDNTHLKFFTYYSFLEMLNRAGLFTVGEFAANARVEETEFENSYNDISPLIAKNLRKREFGNVYQFVFEVKSKQNDETFESDIYRNLDKTATFKAVLYIDDGSGISEEKTISKYIFPENNELTFELTPFKSVDSLRFDPIDTNCVVKINTIQVIDENGTENTVPVSSHNASHVLNDMYYFDTKDPHVVIKADGQIETVKIELEFIDYEFEASDILSILFNKLKESDASLESVKIDLA